MATNLIRCSWDNTDNQLMQQYHDQEWGRPSHYSRHLFELLSLEIMQAGLSWQTVLKKRSAFNQAFHDFDYRQVQGMENDLPSLMKNADIIRNQRKLIAIINNAKVINKLAGSGTTFDRYMWQFVTGKPIQHHYRSHEQVPATTDLAKQISKQMKKAGFSFTGPVIIYSFMQAVGMVNDHEVDCFVYREIAGD